MTLILATRNEHKVREIQLMLPNSPRVLSLKEFPGAPETVEDAPTFEGNAIKKAVTLSRWLQGKKPTRQVAREENDVWVMADDSGLEVEALVGAPGVRSARFALEEEEAPGMSGNDLDAANNAKLLRMMAQVPEERRRARFRCTLALVGADGEQIVFEGTCRGRIALSPSGNGGFGYDPLFIPEGFERTFADLGQDIKNRISHRARALAQFKRFLAG